MRARTGTGEVLTEGDGEREKERGRERERERQGEGEGGSKDQGTGGGGGGGGEGTKAWEKMLECWPPDEAWCQVEEVDEQTGMRPTSHFIRISIAPHLTFNLLP
jgi:hypothetical protein